MNLLAIDAGTSAIKAALVTAEGMVDAVARKEVSARSSMGVDPLRYWAHVADAIRDVAAERPQVDAIAVTGQGDGLWTIGADGTPAGMAFEWNTAVAAEVIGRWEADGTIERHYRRTGTVLWSGATAAIWEWLKTTDPEHAERTGTVFWAKDWVNYQLCGVAATDITDATIPFLDLVTGDYSADLLAGLGCPELEDKLAPIRENGATIGTLTPAAAAATGLSAGIPVLMGCLDVVAMIRGVGVREPGEAMVVLGTTAAAISITNDLDISGEAVGATLRLADDSRYLRVLGANSGTSTLDWYRRAAGCSLEEFWDDVAAGAPGVTMFPYLAGERVPFLAPDATGTFVGITPAGGRAELARSVAHGITYSLRHCLDAIGDSDAPIVLTGGGAASEPWCQLVADVTQRTVLVEQRPHVACVGLAEIAAGIPSTAAEERATYRPQSDLTAEYETFVRIGQQLRPIWADLADHNPTEPHATD